MPLWLHAIPSVQWGVALGVALVALRFDLKSRRIPNALTGPAFLAGLLWAAWMHGLAGFAEALGASILLAVPYILLFLFADGGAGDAKLMAALGAWLGLVSGIVTLFAVAVAGGLLSMAYALLNRRFSSVLVNVRHITATLWLHLLTRSRPADVQDAMPAKERMLTMPYALAVFLGTCLACGAVQCYRA